VFAVVSTVAIMGEHNVNVFLVRLCLQYWVSHFSGEVEKMNKKMEEVKRCDIQVLPEDFLDEVKDGDVMDLISRKNISSWGSDVSIYKNENLNQFYTFLYQVFYVNV
jgi:hypothetical protein